LGRDRRGYHDECECGEQENQQDHRCQDAFHTGSLSGNVGVGESDGSEGNHLTQHPL
jgi:hypothetical protein